MVLASTGGQKSLLATIIKGTKRLRFITATEHLSRLSAYHVQVHARYRASLERKGSFAREGGSSLKKKEKKTKEIASVRAHGQAIHNFSQKSGRSRSRGDRSRIVLESEIARVNCRAAPRRADGWSAAGGVASDTYARRVAAV